jgi:hypothetical protein
MPNPDTPQIAVIAMSRLEGEAGSDAGCSVTTFFCSAAGWRIAMAAWEQCTQNRSVLRGPSATTPCQGLTILSGDTKRLRARFVSAGSNWLD